MTEKSIDELLDSINAAVDEIHKHPTKIEKAPSTLEIVLSGVSNEKGVGFLFSNSVDNLVNNLLSQASSGNLGFKIDEKAITNIFDKFGIGEGSFEGPISRAIVDTIDKSISSSRFQSTKSKLKKVMLVYKELKKKRKEFEDNPELRKKYDDAIYALKKILTLVWKIIKSKKVITVRVSRGLHNIVNESTDLDETIERIEF